MSGDEEVWHGLDEGTRPTSYWMEALLDAGFAFADLPYGYPREFATMDHMDRPGVIYLSENGRVVFISEFVKHKDYEDERHKHCVFSAPLASPELRMLIPMIEVGLRKPLSTEKPEETPKA